MTACMASDRCLPTEGAMVRALILVVACLAGSITSPNDSRGPVYYTSAYRHWGNYGQRCSTAPYPVGRKSGWDPWIVGEKSTGSPPAGST